MSLHREMNRLFDDALGSSGRQGVGVANVINAHLNVSETDKEIRITAELPGVTEKDVDVSLDEDLLTIRGEKKFEETKGGEKENFHFVERSYGTFQRSIRLPFPVDPEQVSANFENGVLAITLPKAAQQERRRKIEVRSANAGGAEGAGPDGATKASAGETSSTSSTNAS